MDIEKLIMDTFTEHEHVTPDDDAVLAAAQQRINRRRAVSRPLAVAAGVAVVAVAATTVMVLNKPADQVGAAAPGLGTNAPARPAPPAIADVTMPYDLGWLPPGDVEYVARRINIGGTAAEVDKPLYGGEYMFNVTKDGQTLQVDVQEMKMMPVDEAAFKSGPGSSVTVGGRHGKESSVSDGPGGYELYLTHPGGTGAMYVNVSPDPQSGSTATAQQLIDTGRRIAENIHFPGTATVSPAFGLGVLPNGLKMCTFDVEKGFGPTADGGPTSTSYQVDPTCEVMPAMHIYAGGKPGATGTPGQPVQGHETRYREEDDYHILTILNAIDDEAVTVAGSVPQADLYAVANNLVLPH